MKKLLGIIVFGILLLSVFFFFTSGIQEKSQEKIIKSIQIGNTILNEIEIADTLEEREKGLSGRDSISENFGLLFIFDIPAMYGFWMKDMNFPIDIIWLDENLEVVGLKTNVDPLSYPQSFSPDKPAKYVLEVRAGLIEKEGLKVGSRVMF